MRILPAILLWIPLSLTASSATILVPSDYPLIQQAIDAAGAGDTVLVSEGTYVENLVFGNKPVTLSSAWGYTETVIDGGHAGSVMVVSGPMHDDTVIRGFTFTHGYANHGGGIHVTDASPRIADNYFVENECIDGGGGIYLKGSAAPVIENNVFERNAVGNSGGAILCHNDPAPIVIGNAFFDNYAAWSGGGINAYYADGIRVERNTFIGNRAGKRGGAVRFTHSAGVIAGNVILDNQARLGGGGGISCSNSVWVTIVNNVVCRNVSNIYGGGINLGPGPATVTNNTVCANWADEEGGGLRCTTGALVTAANNIFWNNGSPVGPEITVSDAITPATLSISHSLVDGGEGAVFVEAGCTLAWGDGMIDADPAFADPEANDFHLTFDSPCREAGLNGAPELPSRDFEGDPRIVGPLGGEVPLGGAPSGKTVDMGADEFFALQYRKLRVK